MLTLRDFLDYCDLTEAEVATISRRESVPPIIAAQLAHLLKQSCSTDLCSAARHSDHSV